MDPTDIGFIKAVVAALVMAGTVSGAVRLWLRVRARPLPDTNRLVEELRDENAQLRSELEAHMAELEARVDFTERRLVQERTATRLPLSRIQTPV